MHYEKFASSGRSGPGDPAEHRQNSKYLFLRNRVRAYTSIFIEPAGGTPIDDAKDSVTVTASWPSDLSVLFVEISSIGLDKTGRYCRRRESVNVDELANSSLTDKEREIFYIIV